MNENQPKRKLNPKGLEMLEWMLAIDFDSVEVRRFHSKCVFQKYVQTLDKSVFTVKRGD